MSNPKCPQCGALLTYGDIMATSPVFPCPACGVQPQVPGYFVIWTMNAAIAAPALVFWALGFSWQLVIVAELLLVYPTLWLALKYGKYVLRPRVKLYVPARSFAENLARLRRAPPGGRSEELQLRDRPRPPWV